MVLPREIYDAVNFFKSIKTSAIVSSEAVLASPIAPELAAYRSGIHISCMDIASSASQSLDACCSLYNYLDTLVSPESQIIADIVVDDTSAVSRGYIKLYSAVPYIPPRFNPAQLFQVSDNSESSDQGLFVPSSEATQQRHPIIH